MKETVTQLRAQIEECARRNQALRGELLTVNAKLSEARRELRKLRAWWRQLQSIAKGGAA